MTKRKEIAIGDRFSFLTVVSIIPTQKYEKRHYLCVCDCGKQRTVKIDNLRGNRVRSCGCYNRKCTSIRKRKTKGQASFNYKEFVYKSAAKKRNLEYKLTKDEFKELVSKNCAWCGSTPIAWNRYYNKDGSRAAKSTTDDWAKEQTIFINGIDRIDSSQGYYKENCLPCCEQCNRMKLDYTEQEFLSQVKKIYEFQTKDRK